MYVGQIVEMAETTRLFAFPKHPYTSALLSSIPEPDPRSNPRRARTNGHGPRRIVLQGEVANPAAPPSGCYFHPRCQFAIDKCKTENPEWRQYTPGHWVRCHRSEELDLPGIDTN